MRPASDRFRARRVLGVAALVTIPLVALAVAWWATRDLEPRVVANDHDHSAMATGGASGDSAMPVTLSIEQARRIGVTYATVTASALPHDIRTVGQVTFDETRVQTIAPKIDGWVEQLFVNFTGRAVQRGEPLMRVYSPMLVTAQEELLLARRLATEVAEGGSATRANAEELVASARRRLAYLDIPAADIANVERTGQVQRTMTLRANATGVVVEKNVTSGQRVMAGDALFRVADLSTVWVEGEVYEQDLRAIRTGQEATAEFDAYPGERWQGRVAYLYPTLSPETRTARVRVALANPGRRLLPGMFATLRITGTTRSASEQVLTVPRGAVLATGERSLVFVRLPDGRLEPRTVTVGVTTDDRVEIIRGVALGETVVASATFLLDAESNLGTALGGMGDMPGMEITIPPASGGAKPPPPSAPAPPARRNPDDHSGHEEP
jgi:membrane fusion protein, copper/silver efflux system